MNCLKDYIGIRGYDVKPESGQFINQLPGISLKSIQHIANSEQVTFVAVWEDVQQRAWIRLKNDFMILMRSKYCLRHNYDTSLLICEDKALFVNAWMYLLGAELMQELMYSERINKFTTIDREKGIELKDMFTGMYENALDAIMPAIKYKETDEQLQKSFSRVERIP